LRRRYRLFLREAFRAMHGKDAIWNWHIDLMCDDLSRVVRGDIDRLVVNVPPGTMKSFNASVCLLPFAWLPGNDPTLSMLSISNSDRFASRDNRKCRALMETDWYQGIKRDLLTLYPEDDWQLLGDQNQKTWFENSLGGRRQSTGIGSNITGMRVRMILLDDVVDAKAALGDASQVGQRMADVDEKLATAVENRLEPGSQTAIINIMQRHHVDDPAGIAIREGWPSLILPAEYDPDIADPRDPRKVPGELLHPTLKGLQRPDLDRYRRRMGDRIYRAQYQQQPSAMEGGLFKRANWHITPRAQFPTEFDMVVVGVDLAFKGKLGSDYCVAYVVGRVGARFWVLHREKYRIEYGEQKAMIRRIEQDWKASASVIEDAATGAPIVDELRAEIPGIQPIPARGSKEARAQVWAPIHEAKQITLPEEAEWLEDCIHAFAQFPLGSHDDDIDALGYAIRYMRDRVEIVIDPKAMADSFARASDWW
jgi:predicted phage terminase large subunit-like protein